ncbi:MAG: hypothetical protein GXO25_01945 [Euryarchaeota archaeon]|nr:hypothetical protein [Euryarchaeota archaeon]
MHYAIIKRDGMFVEGSLPEHVERDKFCIMCAAAFGAGTTAHREYGDEVKEITIKGEKTDVIIVPWQRDLLAVIGSKEDLNKVIEKIKQ